MLAIRRCLFGSSKGGKHDKHKYNDISSFQKEDFHVNISIDPLHSSPKNAQPQPKQAIEDADKLEIEPLHDEITAEEARHDETTVEEARHDETIVVEARFDETLVEEAPLEKIIVEKSQNNETILEEVRPEKTKVEEAQPDETLEELAPLYKLLLEEPEESKLNQIFRDLIGPYKSPEELGDLSNNLGLHDPDRNGLNMCTEILGSESCDNMVNDMDEAVTEWSWSHKRQRKKALDAEMLVNRGLPPPLPRYIGRPRRFMKVTRCNGRITMSEVVMDQQPEMMQIERDDGEIKMQLMTYVGDAENGDAEAYTSAFYSGDAWEDDAESSTSALYVRDAKKNDAEASTSAINARDAQVSTLALYARDAWNDNVRTSTSVLHIRDVQKNDIEASTSSAMNDGDVQLSTSTLYVEDAKKDDVKTSALAFDVGDARSDDAEASTSGMTSEEVVEACEEKILKEEEEEAEEEDEVEGEETANKLDSRKKGKKVAAQAA